MKLARLTLLFAVFLVVVLGCQQPPAPDLLARWQGGEIRIADLDAWLLALPAGERQPPEGTDTPTWLRKKLRGLFARDQLLTQEALDRLAGEPEFQRAFEQRRRAVLVREHLARRNASFDVTREQARAFFETHQAQMARPEQRAFRHLFLAYPEGAGAAERETRCGEAAQIREQVLGGASFEQLVMRHSDSADAPIGGLVGPVTRAQLRGEVGELVFRLEPGAISEVLRNPAGCHLFQVQQVAPAIEPRFELFQERIVQALAEQRRQEWRLERVREEAAARGIALPSWLSPGGVPPTGLAADEVLVDFGDAAIVGRDVLAQVSPERPAAMVLLGMLQNRLLADAAETELGPEATERLLAPERRDLAFRTLSARELDRFVREQQAQLLQDYYEAQKGRYLSDPQLEMTVISWPLGQGDPLRALGRPRALMAALQEGEPLDAVWARFATDPGIRRELIPQTSVRQLATTRPELSAVLAREVHEGDVVGPFRAGARLLVAVIDVEVPARQLSFLEARQQVTQDLVRERGDSLVESWLDGLAKEKQLEIFDEHLQDFGRRLGSALVPEGS